MQSRPESQPTHSPLCSELLLLHYNHSPPELFSGVGGWSSLAVAWKLEEIVLHMDSKSTSSLTLILITDININSQITHLTVTMVICMDIYSVQRLKEGTEFMEALLAAEAGT